MIKRANLRDDGLLTVTFAHADGKLFSQRAAQFGIALSVPPVNPEHKRSDWKNMGAVLMPTASLARSVAATVESWLM